MIDQTEDIILTIGSWFSGVGLLIFVVISLSILIDLGLHNRRKYHTNYLAWLIVACIMFLVSSIMMFISSVNLNVT